MTGRSARGQPRSTRTRPTRLRAGSAAGYGSVGTRLLLAGLAAAGLEAACSKRADTAQVEAYLAALTEQSDYVAARAEAICGDPSALSRHSAIQGLLRDLKQYRIDFEGQVACTLRNECATPQTKAHAPPVFRGVKPDEPDAQGAELSKDTFAKLRTLMGGDVPKPLRQALHGCQSDAMAVAASAAVLVVTCTTKPGTEDETRDRARLAQARHQYAEATARARAVASGSASR
jgi:hypothetical protein